MSTSTTPLRRDAEANRKRILAAARELFAEHGLAVSLDDIAGHAGVGVGTVYRRFRHKDALIDELFEEVLAEIEAVGREALEVEDPWDGLVFFMSTLFARQAADASLKQVLHCHGLSRVEEIRTRIAPLGRQIISRAQDSGQLRSDVSFTDFPLLNGGMLALVIDATRGLDSDVYTRYVTIVLDGLRATRDAPTPLPAEPLTVAQVDEVMRRLHA